MGYSFRRPNSFAVPRLGPRPLADFTEAEIDALPPSPSLNRIVRDFVIVTTPGAAGNVPADYSADQTLLGIILTRLPQRGVFYQLSSRPPGGGGKVVQCSLVFAPTVISSAIEVVVATAEGDDFMLATSRAIVKMVWRKAILMKGVKSRPADYFYDHSAGD
jgi:hypothetical protein